MDPHLHHGSTFEFIVSVVDWRKAAYYMVAIALVSVKPVHSGKLWF